MDPVLNSRKYPANWPLEEARTSRLETCATKQRRHPGGCYTEAIQLLVHTFTNTSADDACVTVILQSPSNVLATAYLNLFDPVNVSSNYLGDAGRGTLGGTTTFSFSVAPGAVFQVVVTEVFTNAVTQPYTLQLSGLPCPPPTLNIQSVATDQARLHWSTASGGYLLEAVPSLGSANWTGVTNEPMVSAGRFNVTNTIDATNRFYRLHKP